jgi:helix-turn-helix, Psq domain
MDSIITNIITDSLIVSGIEAFEDALSSKNPVSENPVSENPVSENPVSFENPVPSENSSIDDDPPELSKAMRIDLAHQAWKNANGKLSMKKAARIFGVSFSTLQGQINGAIPKAQASQAMQRLTVGEEEAICDWLLELSSWGWPVRVEQCCAMAIELLIEKGDTADLGMHWTAQFLS